MLETARLILRPATLSDAYSIFTLNSDPEVMRYTGDLPCPTLSDAEAIVRDRMIPQFERHKMTRFIVIKKAQEEFVGWCGLKYFPETQEVDLGYRFMKKFWGQGFATEASLACLHYGFHQLGLPRVIAKVMPDNKASIKVIQKLGMTFKGHHHDPTDPLPFIRYELLRSDFK